MSAAGRPSLVDVSHFLSTAFKPLGEEEEAKDISREGLLEVSPELLRKLRCSLTDLQQPGDALPADEFLAKCLIYHQNDVGQAKKTIEGFLKFRRAALWPLRIRAQAVEAAGRTGVHWLLPPANSPSLAPDFVWRGNKQRQDAGPAGCVVLNMSRMDPAVCSVEEYQKLSMFIMEQVTDDPAVQHRGIALIVDFDGAPLSKLMSLVRTDDMRRGVMLWKGAFPCRLRRIWLIDPPSAVQYLLWGVLRLLGPTVRERVRMGTRSSGLEELRQDLGPLFQLPTGLKGSTDLDWDATWQSFMDHEAMHADRRGVEPHGVGPHEDAMSLNASSGNCECISI